MPRNRSKYLQQVADFILKHGPEFKLNTLDHGAALACQCCGYYPIKAHYHVENAKGEEFIVGSECQTMVLDFTEAHLPAAMVRKLNPEQLVTLGQKYGLDLDPTTAQEQLAKDVIAARRSFANSAGWASRRAQGKATQVQEQLQIPETN